MTHKSSNKNEENAEIRICTQCKNSNNSVYLKIKERASIPVHRTSCTGICDRPSNVTINSPIKNACLFVDITTDDIDTFLNAVDEYLSHKCGHINFNNLPKEFQKKYLCKIPKTNQ